MQFLLHLPSTLMDSFKWNNFGCFEAQSGRMAESLVDSVATYWTHLVNWAGSTVDRRVQLVGLVRAMVQTVCPSTAVGCLDRHEMVTTWLYEQITDTNTRPEYKADVIELLPAVVLQRRDDIQLQRGLVTTEEALLHAKDMFGYGCVGDRTEKQAVEV
ncbi:hypothetical protein J6590_090501 [Homalodisca vitripennis]|nr:hypothetical protein J6590_090501 [Homalodisca vitripennis]